jgi:hypothetical protein
MSIVVKQNFKNDCIKTDKLQEFDIVCLES